AIFFMIIAVILNVQSRDQTRRTNSNKTNIQILPVKKWWG
ncbi:MAG: hypothetical protein ACJARG_001991, partial [Arcticibacterium sp.]